ncbi:hypothetical protein [Nocardia sp. NPDC049707]|uniref:MarR family winged helix-turn-helix transcriptional regulator n=1 Tax=Nocardia sp. NPDC049707 TaxID=3154735 RepID=UPI0034263DED
MEKSGYVQRERNPRDRRSYVVTVTDAGHDRLHQAEAAIPAYLDKTFAALTAGKRRQLTALLGKLLVPAG